MKKSSKHKGNWLKTSALAVVVACSGCCLTACSFDHVNQPVVETYIINYELGGGTNSSSNPTAYTQSATTITLSAPTRDGYTFAGWYTNANYTGDPITELDINRTGNITLYAKWILTTLSPFNFTTDTDGKITVTGLKDSTITEIIIPDVVSYIADLAFLDCSGLTSITIPDTVTSIGSHVFSGCTGLTSIKMPNSVTSIGAYAFSDCGSLTSITIPDSVTSIGTYAFRNCSSLTSITIPDSVTSIADEAFTGCNYLIEVYDLSNLSIAVSSTDNGRVGYYAKVIHTSLSEASNLVTANNGVVYYVNANDYLAVRYVGSSTAITLDDKTTAIERAAFSGRSSLISIKIPDSVTSIGERSFYDCSGLTSITLGNGVTSIGEYAFADCSRLTKVTIPQSVTSIGTGAFAGCSRLTNVTFADPNGWHVSVSYTPNLIDTTDTAKNAEYLISYHVGHDWWRE